MEGLTIETNQAETSPMGPESRVHESIAKNGPEIIVFYWIYMFRVYTAWVDKRHIYWYISKN